MAVLTEVSPRIKVRGALKLALIRDLAFDERAHADLAEEYGITRSNVSHFARMHQREIDAVERDLQQEVTNECAGLWIADKAARIAEYQDVVERVNEKLDSLKDSDYVSPGLLKEKTAALRAAAEELGQIPERPAAPASTASVEYNYHGMSDADLTGRLT